MILTRFICLQKLVFLSWGTPLYKLYRYVPPHQVGFLHRFGLKTVWNWVLFSRELRECKKVFIVLIPNEYERKRNMRIRNRAQNFCLKARCENGYGF